MLQKQLVHLNMSGGLQKKDDQFIVIPSKLAVADDVQFDDASTVVRRGGQASASFGALTSQAYRAFTHQGVAVIEQASTLTRVGAGGVSQVLNPAVVDGFSPPRAAPRAGMLTTRVAGILAKGSAYGAGIPFYDGSFDCATVGNITCYVFETRSAPLGTQTVRVVLVDDANNYFRLYDTVLTDGTKILVKPRVVANASKFFIFVGSFTSGATVFTIKSMTLSTAGSASGLSAAIFTSGAGAGTIEGTSSDQVLFDVAFSSDLTKLGLVIRDLNATTDLYFYSLNTSDGSSVLGSNQVTPSVRPRSLTALFTKDATDYKLHAFYSINTNVLKAANYNFTTATGSVETTVGTGAGGTGVARVAAYENSTTQIYLAFDTVDANGSSLLRLSSCTHAYASLSECATFSPWYIAGRIGVVNSRLYLPMVFLSGEYQNTVYVIDLTSALANLGVTGATGEPPYVVARVDYGEVAIDRNKLTNVTRVPNMPVRSSSLILPYLKYETDLRLAGTTNDTAYALARAVIDFNSQLGHEEINGITFVAGACPYIFDGSVYVEEGFHHGPEIVAVGSAAASGTYTFPNASDTFTFCLTWAWQDGQGNWWESAPSGEKTITIVAGSGNYSITPTVLSPPTQKPNARLLMYRTKGDSTDTTLYLATTYAGAALISDADLGGGEQLYTAGNVLPNTPAPACRHVSTFQKRLVLSGCGDGSRVHWSKVTTPGFGVEFSSGDPTHQTAVPADKGRVVGTEELDNQLVILCENGVGVIGGSGPNDSGTQGQYSDFATIISETGCSWDSPKSIIRGPEGVWFRSPFGIRLVSRSGGLGLAPDGKQAGAEVDSLVSGNLVAVVGDAKQQIRFYQSSGTVLIWDYQWKQWTRFTGHANIDAVYADDRYYHLSNYSTTTPLLRYTDETAILDVSDAGAASTTFAGYVETAWLSFAGIQGFQRVYRLMVLGRFVDTASSLDPQTINLFVEYDFAAASPPSGKTASTLVAAASSGAPVQAQHHFAKQKCEALKIGISFAPDLGVTKGRFRLTDLTLQVGVKPGYYKLPSSQRF